MLVAVRVPDVTSPESRILAATPEAGNALNLARGSLSSRLDLQAFLKLVESCKSDFTLRPEWRSEDGRAFTLSNIGMMLPGETSTVLIRLTLVRNNAPGTSALWRSALQFGLSAREATVCELLAGGASDKKIGETMKISQHTARSHLRSIYRKLNVAGRIEAIGKLFNASNPPDLPAR